MSWNLLPGIAARQSGDSSVRHHFWKKKIKLKTTPKSFILKMNFENLLVSDKKMNIERFPQFRGRHFARDLICQIFFDHNTYSTYVGKQTINSHPTAWRWRNSTCHVFSISTHFLSSVGWMFNLLSWSQKSKDETIDLS